MSGTVDTITASTTGTITGSGTITGNTSVALTTGSGAIGALTLSTPNVTANTTGNVTLTDLQAMTGNGASTGANFNLTDNAGYRYGNQHHEPDYRDRCTFPAKRGC